MSDSTTRRIPLTQGRFALVDAADFEMLSRFIWCVSSGYPATNVGAGSSKRLVRMHRMLLLPDVGHEVDHINRDPLDNRRANLRLCSHHENSWNMSSRGRGSSRYKGVSWSKVRSRWLVHIRVHPRLIYLGYFDSEVDAARAYDAAAVRYRGEFARLNVPDERA